LDNEDVDRNERGEEKITCIYFHSCCVLATLCRQRIFSHSRLSQGSARKSHVRLVRDTSALLLLLLDKPGREDDFQRQVFFW